mmetsp:Transcript_5794/g.6640  ORF Transcript_5794/g.6640 Transcript_5794/m.6640 type:complete len:214 (-) Transcript_5794:411-1052(-)
MTMTMLCVKMTIKATIAFIIFSACINFAAVDATSMSTSDVNIVNTQQEQEQANNKEHSVPTFSISDLRRLSYSKSRLSNSDNDISSHSRSDEFREVLSTTGLLAVRLDDNDENGRHDDDDNNNSYETGIINSSNIVNTEGMKMSYCKNNYKISNSVCLKVRESNKAAIQMYLKLGYLTVWQEKEDKNSNENILVMRKQLSYSSAETRNTTTVT